MITVVEHTEQNICHIAWRVSCVVSCGKITVPHDLTSASWVWMRTKKLTNPFDALCSPGRRPSSLDVMNSLLANSLSLVHDITKLLEMRAAESLLGMCYTCIVQGRRVTLGQQRAKHLVHSIPLIPARTGDSRRGAGAFTGLARVRTGNRALIWMGMYLLRVT